VLEYFALFFLLFTFIVVFYGIIAIHDIPYDLAKQRNHPHQDAIHYAGWVSLFTLHAIWPFLWIWAMLYRDDRGWGFSAERKVESEMHTLHAQIAALKQRLDALENRHQEGA